MSAGAESEESSSAVPAREELSESEEAVSASASSSSSSEVVPTGPFLFDRGRTKFICSVSGGGKSSEVVPAAGK